MSVLWVYAKMTRKYKDPRPKPVGRVSVSRVDRLAVLYRELEQAAGGADPGAFLQLAARFAEERALCHVVICERLYKELT